jgi:multiple sugar transport system substrate-binding protein
MIPPFMRHRRAWRVCAACLLALGFNLPVTMAAEAPETLIFWHTQGEDRADLLEEIIADYNASGPPMPVEAVYMGSYGDIFQKTRTNLIAGSPPDMAVAYESMVAEYRTQGKVVDLDRLLNDPQIGLDADDMADFHPSFLEQNRYPEFDEALLSFPFTKSLLVLYVNEDRIAEAGFSAAPQTWEEFFEQCVAVKKLGMKGYAFTPDASTLDGMFISRGARLLAPDNRTTLFEEPAIVRTFDFLRRLAAEGGLSQVDGRSDEDLKEFVQQKAAFFIRSSTRRPVLQEQIAGKFRWSMNLLPHDPGIEPMTILYGANICLFDKGEERVRAAWEFIKHFTSTDVTARWALGSGYMPVRRSAEQSPEMLRWFDLHPVNRRIISMIPAARFEPRPRGWQQVRPLIERVTLDAVLARGDKTAEVLAAELKAEADLLLTPAQERQGSRGATYIALAVVVLVFLLILLFRRRS